MTINAVAGENNRRTAQADLTDYENDWEGRIAAEARRQAEDCFHTARVPTQFQSAFVTIVETVLRTVRGATHGERRAALMVRESSSPALILLDAHGKIVFWNRGAEALYGFSSLGVVGEDYSLLWRPEDREDNAPRRALAQSETGLRSRELWQVRESGVPFCAQTILTPLRGGAGKNEGGGVSGFVFSVRDATVEADERKRLATALASEQQRAQISERAVHLMERHFLPPIQNGVMDGFDVSTFYAAALDEANIGGDFFDAFRLKDGSSVFVVGDASGKGLEAAGRAAEVRLLLRTCLRQCGDALGDVPAQALAKVNALMCECVDLDKLAPDTFTSVSLILFHAPTGRLFVTTAGGEPPCLVREDGTALLVEGGCGPVLGVFPGARYHSARVTLTPGESVLLFTDGLTEARPKRGALFGTDGVLKTLSERAGHGDSSHQLGQALLEAASRHAGNILADDVCLLVVRRRPEP